MLDRDKKEKVDEIILEIIEHDEGCNYSYSIRSIVNSVPASVKDEWEDDIVESEVIATFYECLLDSEGIIGKAFNRTKKLILNRLISNTRLKQTQKNKKSTSRYIPAINIKLSEEVEEFYIDDLFDSDRSFLYLFFYKNIDNILTTDHQREYVKKGDVYFYENNISKKTGKKYKNYPSHRRFCVEQSIKKCTLRTIKKTYDTDDIAIAEIKYNIGLIKSIINSKNIGATFNKYKNEPILFNLFYDNISAKSRKSINTEEYSIYSILELKNALKAELLRLQRSL